MPYPPAASPPIVLLLLSLLLAGSSPLCTRTECRCTFYQQHVLASCHFENRQRLTLEAGDFPEELSSVELEGGKELRFGLAVLAKLKNLESVTIRNASKVLVQKHSFANLSASSVRFEFSDSGSLLLEEGSFRNLRGPVSASIRGVGHLVVQRAAFTWLSHLVVARVSRLELLDQAFSLDNPLDRQAQAPVTTITLESVSMESIGRSTFHSSAKEIRIVNSLIKTIKTDAFDAIEIRRIVIENSTVHQIASGAFNERTLVVTLRLTNVLIQDIAPGALPFGSTQLIIEKSKINKVHKGAINITVAEVILNDNSFGTIKSMGVHLQKWNTLCLSNNRFERLESEAFSAPVQPPIDKDGWFPECNFTGNTLKEFGSNVFDFSLTDDVTVNIDNNNFVFKCHCDMSSSIETLITGSINVYSSLFETGYCNVDQRMSRCYKLTPGFVSMWNFTDRFCQEPVVCEEKHQRDAALPPVIPMITATDNIMVQDEIERERLIMGSIFVIFLIGMFIVLLVSLIKWVKDYNYCSKARTIVLSAINPVFGGNQIGESTPTGSAHSVSRLSVHEYAELQKKSERLPQPEDPQEDKATQTLPEELTQELLQSLREKLNDPADYKEARDMIEHLYDLIKVEDSCNRNETVSLNIEDMEKEGNVYEVPRRRSEPGRQRVSTGTRAPSPDKLLPLHGTYRRPAVLCEYLEPRDRAVHLYSELSVPLADYNEPNDSAQHVYAELPELPPVPDRPLPATPSQL